MNRQKREDALRNSSESEKQPDQPNRGSQPRREQVRNNETGSQERHQPQREPGKLPLPE
jgi:hypothetical protein